jgi:PleD family two-component response regulator
VSNWKRLVSSGEADRRPSARKRVNVKSVEGRPSVSSESPFRILLVDDDPDLAELLALLLQWRGYQVEVTLDGKSAIDTAARIGSGGGVDTMGHRPGGTLSSSQLQ